MAAAAAAGRKSAGLSNKLLHAYNEIDAALKRASQAAGTGAKGKSEVNRLQAALPKIVVVGSQSAGKSSVLNKLAGTEARLLAIGGGRTVTRTPIRLQLVCEDRLDGKPYAYVYIQGNNRGAPITAVGDAVDLAVRARTTELTGDTSFSKTEIVVEYHDVGVVPLTLVDLPGLMAGGMVESDKEAVYDIVKYFAVQENTIVVAVSKSTDDGANDPSFNLIRLHHPNTNWIAVHSKLDLLEADEDGPEKMREKVEWLRDAKVGHNGKHFGVIAVPRTPDELAAHEKFWGDRTETAGWIDSVGEPVTFGVGKLSACMHDKLLAGFRSALPELVATLDESIAQAQEVIDTTPPKIDGDIDDFRKIVTGIISEVVDTIGPEPKSAYTVPESIDQAAVLAAIKSQLDGYVMQQEQEFLSWSVEVTYKKLKTDPSTMYQDYDHGDVPLFHEIINRFDYEKNPRLKDMVTEAFRGYLNVIVTDLVLPKLQSVKWKGSERLNVTERYPNLAARLTEHITTFFIGGKRIQSRKDAIMGYISDTVVTILLLTAKFAPAQSVKEHEARESLKAKEELASRMQALDELKSSEFYGTVIDRETERLLTRLVDAVRSKKTSQRESELLLHWMTSAANLITSQDDPDPLSRSGTTSQMSKAQKRMSAIVGGGSVMKRRTNYVKLIDEGPDAGKVRWYKNKDHFITSPTTPIGEIDIRHDKPSLTRFQASLGPKHGIHVKTAKFSKRFQYSSRTEREDMLAEMERWLGSGGTEVVRFTGWFTKKGKGTFDGYRRRFFVLTGTKLTYFISEGAGFGAELKGTIKIKPGTTATVEEGEIYIATPAPEGTGKPATVRRLRADGGTDKAEELARAINECVSESRGAALSRLEGMADDVIAAQSSVRSRRSAPKGDAAAAAPAGDDHGRRPRNLSAEAYDEEDDFDDVGSMISEWMAGADEDGVFASGEMDAITAMQIRADLKKIYEECFSKSSGTVAQYTRFQAESHDTPERKREIVNAVADLRQQFTYACRYIGDQLKLELAKLFQLLRRELGLRAEHFVDDIMVEFKGNPEGLAEMFELKGEDEAARRDRAEKRVACYEEAKAKCQSVQRGLH
mmetsp:Transcript_13881/g.35727  ORF Transcript_13881/g.35727 Transcript_13881/m.35727 type:complete len:1095 (+) Transcript_13881:72-3356(+)